MASPPARPISAGDGLQTTSAPGDEGYARAFARHARNGDNPLVAAAHTVPVFDAADVFDSTDGETA